MIIIYMLSNQYYGTTNTFNILYKNHNHMNKIKYKMKSIDVN